MTIEGDQFSARQEMDDPPAWRILFDDGTGPVQVGIIWGAEPCLWRWGLDHQLTDVSRRINGTTWSYEMALQTFRAAFLKWMGDHAVEWPSIQDSLRE